MSASSDASVTGACRVEVQPFVIDAKVRVETGIALTSLPEVQWVVGYASGDTPKAASVDAAGKVMDGAVDASKLPAKGDPKAQRILHRVTPIEWKDSKARVAVDLTDTMPDKTRFVQCGPLEEPIFVFHGRSLHEGGEGEDAAAGAAEVRECRTFYTEEPSKAWALGSRPRHDGSKYESQWILGAAGAGGQDGGVEDASAGATVVERRDLAADKDGAPPKAERNTFEAVAGLQVGEAGYVAASRINGQLHVARRRSLGEALGTVANFWPNAAVGTPVLASTGSTVSVVFAMMSKPELMGLTFAIDKAPKAPQKIALDEVAEGADRKSVTSAYLARGDLAVAFAEGAGKARRARIVLLDSELRPRGAVTDALPESVNAQEIKIGSLGEDRLLMTYIELSPTSVPSLKGAVLNCK